MRYTISSKEKTDQLLGIALKSYLITTLFTRERRCGFGDDATLASIQQYTNPGSSMSLMKAGI